MSKAEEDDFAARLSALRTKLYGETANPQPLASSSTVPSATLAAAPLGTNDVDELTTRFHSLFGTTPVPKLVPTGTSGAAKSPTGFGMQDEHGDIDDELDDELDDEAWDRLVSGGDGSSGLKDIIEDMTGTKNTELKHEDWDIKDLLKTTKDSTTAATSSEDEIARLLEEAKASLEVPTTKGKDEDIDGSKVDPEHEDEDKPEEDEEEEEEDELTQITRILNQARDAAALEAEEEKANPKAPSPIPSTPPLPYTSDTDLIMPPSPPKSTTQPSTTTEPITDDELSLRLLNLRRDMPTQSLPFHDAPKKDGTADESDDENWCTMCAMDAEFRCSGCDGEVYCENCLWESHQGPSAGWEEKRHKWTRMDRGKMVGIGG